MTGFAAANVAAIMLVAGIICMMGGDLLMESIQQLSDSSNKMLYCELKIMVDDYVEHHDNHVLHAPSIHVQQVGSSAFVDITVETPTKLSTTATRAVEERLRQVIVQKLQDSNEDTSL
jgi:divalent metal cation (Fe/Co/Zn/Cd) transporter